MGRVHEGVQGLGPQGNFMDWAGVYMCVGSTCFVVIFADRYKRPGYQPKWRPDWNRSQKTLSFGLYLLLKRRFPVSLDKNEYWICAVFHKIWVTGGKRLDVVIFALKSINTRQCFQRRHSARNRRKSTCKKKRKKVSYSPSLYENDRY